MSARATRTGNWDGGRQRGGRSPLLGLLFVLVAATVAGLAFYVGQGARDGSPPAGGVEPPSTSTETSAPVVPVDDPVETAKRWLAAYRSLSFTDASPTAWVDRVRPLSSARLARELGRARDGSPGADWAAFVARRCRTDVEQLDGTVPDEAPRSTTSVYVQVSATAVTRCAPDRTAPVASEPLALTVAVTRDEDGAWRVSRQLF